MKTEIKPVNREGTGTVTKLLRFSAEAVKESDIGQIAIGATRFVGLVYRNLLRENKARPNEMP